MTSDPNPEAREHVEQRVPGETLHKGMFLIRPSLEDVDLGGVTARHGSYSQVWKGRLRSNFISDPLGLYYRLSEAGLNLIHLYSAIEHWCEPPTSVIHAPQKSRHFQILIEVLDLDENRVVVHGHGSSPWWQLAWAEIQRSRGQAIQSGFLEKEIIEEELVTILRGLLPQIRKEATTNARFRLLSRRGLMCEGISYSSV